MTRFVSGFYAKEKKNEPKVDVLSSSLATRAPNFALLTRASRSLKASILLFASFRV